MGRHKKRQVRARQFRVRSKNTLLEQLILEFLRRNKHMNFPDLGELALMTFFQAHADIETMLRADFLRLAPDMNFVAQYKEASEEEEAVNGG